MDTWQDETVQALKQGYQDEIDKLQARVAELEQAARPVADWLETIYESLDDSDIKELWLTVGQIRTIAALLQGKPS